MKTFHRKLALNKKTVANLHNKELDTVKGGTLITIPISICGFCTGETCGPCAYTVDCPTTPTICPPGL